VTHQPPTLPPIRFQRDPLITAEESARIHELALSILADVGMQIHHDAARERLATAGFRVSGERVFFDAPVVESYVDEMRRHITARPRAPEAVDDGQLSLSISSYSLWVQDLKTGEVVPYTTDRLIEMTKLVDTLTDDRVYGVPPGIPIDVHPDLHPLAQYRIAALNSRQGASPVDPTSAATVNHLFDMAEVMGSPIDGLPVYLPSPLRLGGESLDVVLACLDRLARISVSSMPSTGANAPLHPFGALALAAAELMGGLVTLRLLTGKPVTFHVDIFPFDLRAGSQVFGSPENLRYQMLCADFNRFYGWPASRGPGNTHVMSKTPDSQAAADKAAIMAWGASLGQRHFGAAGTLSLDEIFSAEQLLVDIEIRDWVQAAIQGPWLGEEIVDDWLAEIRAGAARSFVGLDSTLDYYKAQTWYPRRFERGAIGRWISTGHPQLSDRLRDEARRRIAYHEFELDADRRREIERIYAAAQRAVGG
jgi:trimethylamine---corrinoid protein Co-methyltransferase